MDFKAILTKLDSIGSKQNLNEGWEDMLKAAKEKSGPQPSGGGGVKKGHAYGGSKQKDEPEKEEPESKKAKKKVKEADEKIEEDDVEEGNEFSGELAKAKAAGKKEFEVDGKTYPVKGKMNEAEDKDKDDEDKDDEDKDDKDEDKDDDKDEDKKEKVDESLQECYDQAMGQMKEQESGINVSVNMDTRSNSQSLTVSAQGKAADELAQILKLSGLLGDGVYSRSSEVSMEEGNYANEPAVQVQGIETQMSQGNDLNRPKGTYPKVAGGDNPMQRAIAAMESKAAADLNALEKQLTEQLRSLKINKK